MNYFILPLLLASCTVGPYNLDMEGDYLILSETTPGSSSTPASAAKEALPEDAPEEIECDEEDEEYEEYEEEPVVLASTDPTCGRNNLRFNRRKDENTLLVLRSETQPGYKVLLPRACGQPSPVAVTNIRGRTQTGEFCGFANGGRAHYCFPSLRTMPSYLTIGSKRVIIPKRCICKTPKRCE